MCVVLLLCPTAARTRKDPCPPGGISVPALTLPWELAWPSRPSVHLHLLWPSRTSDQKQRAWDTLDTFPSKTVLYPTYFSPLAPPHPLSLPRQGQLLLVLCVAGDEWWLLGLFLRCKWQAACSPCPHSPGSSQAAEAVAGVSFQRAREARWHSERIQWVPVGVGALRV